MTKFQHGLRNTDASYHHDKTDDGRGSNGYRGDNFNKFNPNSSSSIKLSSKNLSSF